MSIAMLIMLVAVVGIVAGAGFMGYMLGRQRLPPAMTPDDRRLAEQMERIELLESELTRLRDQADFTERLLEERGKDASGEPR